MMNAKIISLLSLLVVCALAGCAALKENDVRLKEKNLAAAGFVAKPVVTAQQQAVLASLTPYKIQARIRNGSPIYLYADPSQNVVYVGGAQAYAAYKALKVDQERVAEEQMTELQFQTMNPWLIPNEYALHGPPPPPHH